MSEYEQSLRKLSTEKNLTKLFFSSSQGIVAIVNEKPLPADIYCPNIRV